MAASSKPNFEPGERSTWMSPTEPSFLTTAWRITCPEIFALPFSPGVGISLGFVSAGFLCLAGGGGGGGGGGGAATNEMVIGGGGTDSTDRNEVRISPPNTTACANRLNGSVGH